MLETLEKADTLKTITLEKDTWILEVPAEVCEREGFAAETLVSLTLKNSGLQSSFIHPTEKSKKSAERFINKYGDFMKKIEKIDD